MGIAMLKALSGIMGPIPLDNATPYQKQLFEGKKMGTKDTTLAKSKRKFKISISRKAQLRAALKRLHISNGLQDRQNRYNKSHRSLELQDKYEQRIISITARRFNTQPGEQFPLQAIIKMADLGVREAIDKYNQLHNIAETMNISVRQAYDHFVLGHRL